MKTQSTLIAATCLLLVFPATAATVVVDSLQVGGFFADGSKDNFPEFQNYFVGYGTIGSVRTAERRSFFVFDLSSVTAPVTAATLGLELPLAGLVGDEPSEIFVLTSTPVPKSTILSPGLSAPEVSAAFSTFGTGVLLAPELGMDTGAPPVGPIVMTLNAAGISAVNANLGGFLVLTGRMASWDFDPPASEPHELMFGHTDVVFLGEPGIPEPFLTLTTVPEPGRLMLLLAGFMLAAGRRRRRVS